MGDLPALVTLHVWRVRAAAVPLALTRLALDPFRLRGTAGLRFHKSLGTSTAAFGVRDVDPTRWALLCSWDTPRAACAAVAGGPWRRWGESAVEAAHLDLRPLRSRGRWSRREPFGRPDLGDPDGHDGPVAVITRARLRPARAAAFWRASAPVAGALSGATGLRVAFGIGEAPVGVQGTVSLWDGAGAMRRFAYGAVEHRDVVARTPREGWYAEELFARFAVEDAGGTIGGVAVR